MTPAAAAIRLGEAVARESSRVGSAVSVAPLEVLDRSDSLPLGRPGRRSANRSCRLVRAADGWLAVNLARTSDRELIPAWMGMEPVDNAWLAFLRFARSQPANKLIDRAILLGLPAARVSEVEQGSLVPPALELGTRGPAGRSVIDLSALWAGPLCGALMAKAGFRVTKVESKQRPDTTAAAMPKLDRRLNGAKERLVCNLEDPAHIRRLRSRILEAGIVITSSRRRAYEQIGLDPAAMFRERPGLIWVAISGYGWTGEGAHRVAFGDDAAAAGGLLHWNDAGHPRFIGDALADPLTGMAAAAAAFTAIAEGGGTLVDAAMTRIAAGAALS